MPPRFIQHHGKKILYLDLACASPGQHNAGLLEAERVIGGEPERSVLLLVDMSCAGHNHETERLAERFGAVAGHRVRARAVVGASGLKRRLVAAGAGELESFDDLGDARDWLARR
jgi:hypothetical protein